jgi:hypothetical protein
MLLHRLLKVDKPGMSARLELNYVMLAPTERAALDGSATLFE